MTQYFKSLFIAAVLQVLAAGPALCQPAGITDKAEYVSHVLTDKLFKNIPESVSLSFQNIPTDRDKSAVTSLVDAYLWITNVRTTLRVNSDADVIFIYLQNLTYNKDLSLNNNLIDDLYHQNFSVIETGGSCTRFYIRSRSSDFEKSIVFIDSTAIFDSRVSCVYRYFRARFGLNEKYNMEYFGDTLLMDLRILRCRQQFAERDQLVKSMANGAC